MYLIIWTTISQVIFGLYLYSTVSYINPAKRIEREVSQAFVAAFDKVDLAYQKYYQYNALTPSTINDLMPDYVYSPAIKGVSPSWLLGSGTGTSTLSGEYICLSATMTRLTLDALQRAAVLYSPQQFFIHSSGCGMTVNDIPLIAENSPGQTIYVTYWISPLVFM